MQNILIDPGSRAEKPSRKSGFQRSGLTSVRLRHCRLHLIGSCIIIIISLLTLVRAQSPPIIGAVTPSTNIVVGTPLLLWATNILDASGISSVWCVVTPPDYDGQGGLPQANLTWNAATSNYELFYTNFTEPGSYICAFYARDNLGLLSSAQQSTVTATDAYEPDDTSAQATIFPVGANTPPQLHNFHSALDEDWVKFYATTGFVYIIEATQLGTNSDLRLDLYYELADGSLEFIDYADDYGWGVGVTESLTLDLLANPFDLEAGVYYVRVSSANTNLFGPGSDYTILIYEPTGLSGGQPTLIDGNGGGLLTIGNFVVYIDPPQAMAAGGAWRVVELNNQTYYNSNTTYGLPIPDSGNWTLGFRPVGGFIAPTNTTLHLISNGTTTIDACYVYSNLSPLAVSSTAGAKGVFNITYLGYAGKRYAIGESTNLFIWKSLMTNPIPQDGLLRFTTTNPPSKNHAFYRTLLIQ